MLKKVSQLKKSTKTRNNSNDDNSNNKMRNTFFDNSVEFWATLLTFTLGLIIYIDYKIPW